jgi:hypothetical protein
LDYYPLSYWTCYAGAAVLDFIWDRAVAVERLHKDIDEALIERLARILGDNDTPFRFRHSFVS